MGLAGAELAGRISIHAPARGATPGQGRRKGDRFYFNPRTREGCDTDYRSGVRTAGISIHAPARGATQSKGTPRRRLRYFNPRTREGCDEIICIVMRLGIDFNPRTREGCDGVFLRPKRELIAISIHAPARGATMSICRSRIIRLNFNPRTREGCDRGFIQKNKQFSDIPLYFFFCGAVQTAHWTQKPTFKPHIRRTLAKRPAQ